MVTIPEYQKQLQTRRTQIVTAQKKAEAYKIKVRRIQRQLRVKRAPLSQMIRVRKERKARGLAKARALGRVRGEWTKQEKLEREFAPKLKEYQVYQVRKAKLADWNRAVSVHRTGWGMFPSVYRSLKPRVREYVKKLSKSTGWRPPIEGYYWKEEKGRLKLVKK